MAEGVRFAVTSVRFSAQADLDLDEIYDYLSRIPARHAAGIIRDLDRTVISIGENPSIGLGESELTRELGREVRSVSPENTESSTSSLVQYRRSSPSSTARAICVKLWRIALSSKFLSTTGSS